jgi:hypothetical protein
MSWLAGSQEYAAKRSACGQIEQNKKLSLKVKALIISDIL